jgi:glucuronosyltransferase
MGSMIRAETLPEDKRNAFLQAFSELPQRVLWKWEADTLPGQPENVKVAKWLPQFDILSMQT